MEVKAAITLDRTYSTVREEANAVFSAIRTLIGVEYGAFLTALAAIMSAVDIHAVLGLSIVATAIPLLASRLGFHWFHQALRQNAFLVALMEVPLYQAKQIDHLPWILSNRAEPLLVQDARRRHKVGGDLLEFLSQQLVLVAAAAGAAVLAGVRAWHYADVAQYLLAVSLAFLITFTCCQLWKYHQEAKGLPQELTRRWLAFEKSHGRLIRAYLQSLEGSTDLA